MRNWRRAVAPVVSHPVGSASRYRLRVKGHFFPFPATLSASGNQGTAIDNLNDLTAIRAILTEEALGLKIRFCQGKPAKARCFNWVFGDGQRGPIGPMTIWHFGTIISSFRICVKARQIPLLALTPPGKTIGGVIFLP